MRNETIVENNKVQSNLCTTTLGTPNFFAVVDRWPLFRGRFMLWSLKLKLQNGGRCWQVVAIRRWSLTQAWLYELKRLFCKKNRTAEVTEAIQKGTLNSFAGKCSKQLKEIVKLVRNGLSPGVNFTNILQTVFLHKFLRKLLFWTWILGNWQKSCS